MKHLFLVRHAKSSWADETLCDRERPLNARGESQLAPLGNALKAAGAFEGEIFSSDATRAIATLEGPSLTQLLPSAASILASCTPLTTSVCSPGWNNGTRTPGSRL